MLTLACIMILIINQLHYPQMLASHRTLLRLFTTAKPDHHYLRLISTTLAHNNINAALQHLLQSHFDNVILDRQIYARIYGRMEELGYGITYKQVLYKMYRDRFGPCLLMVDCMGDLARTADAKLRELVQGDFRAIGWEVPQAGTCMEEEEDRKTLRALATPPPVPSTPVVQQAMDLEMLDQGRSLRIPRLTEANLQYYPELYPATLRSLYAWAGQQPKITMHNVEFIYGESEEMESMEEHGAQEQREAWSEDDSEEVIESLRRVRIGRVEFECGGESDGRLQLSEDVKKLPDK